MSDSSSYRSQWGILKSVLSLLFLGFVILFFYWFGVIYKNEALGASPTAPTSLLTEGLTDPVDVSDETPEFSAIYNDPDPVDNATAYRIIITGGWDSGVVAMPPVAQGQRIPDVSYGGVPLDPSTLYTWRIMFRDQGGAWSPMSALANFTTAAPPPPPPPPGPVVGYGQNYLGTTTKVFTYDGATWYCGLSGSTAFTITYPVGQSPVTCD